MVVFDSSVLLLLLDKNAAPPNDPATCQPVTRAQDRMAFLVNSLTSEKNKILIQ